MHIIANRHHILSSFIQYGVHSGYSLRHKIYTAKKLIQIDIICSGCYMKTHKILHTFVFLLSLL